MDTKTRQSWRRRLVLTSVGLGLVAGAAAAWEVPSTGAAGNRALLTSTSGYGPYSVVGTGSYGLNVRSQPSTSASLVGHLANGASVYLACQVGGVPYSTGGSPATDAIWDQLSTGGYVADYWMSTPAVGTFSAGIPMCQTQTSPPSGSGPQSPPGWLEPGSRLTAGQSVTSTNGGFQLLMQGDGNLVSYLDPAVYGHAVPIWNSGTYGHSGAYSVMQSDGNLVVYAPGGQALWWSGTNGHPGALAVMQSDGNLVVYSAYSGGSALWNSHTYGRTVTTPSTYCTANQNVFGNDTWKVCEYTTVWFNGAHSGVLSPTAVHEGCAAIGPLPLGESINCGPETQGSYIRSGNVNEDWVNQMIVDANSQSYNTYYCVYLRVDTPPGGNAWAQQPQLVSKGVIKPTC